MDSSGSGQVPVAVPFALEIEPSAYIKSAKNFLGS